MGSQARARKPGGVNLPNAWGRTVDGTRPNGTGVVIGRARHRLPAPCRPARANIIGGYDFIAADGVGDYTTANIAMGDPTALQTPATGTTTPMNAAWIPRLARNAHGGHHRRRGQQRTGADRRGPGGAHLPLRVLGVCGGYTSGHGCDHSMGGGQHGARRAQQPHPARVISMSFGRSGSCSATYQAAISAAISAGATVVVSTGNDYSRSTITQPGQLQRRDRHPHTHKMARSPAMPTRVPVPASARRVTTSGVLDNTGTTVPRHGQL